MSARRRGASGDKKGRRSAGRGTGPPVEKTESPLPPITPEEPSEEVLPEPLEEKEESKVELVIPPSPEEQEIDLKPCILSRLALSGLRDDMWTEEHKATMDQFLKDVTKQLLVIYIDEFAGLKTEFLMPPQEQKQITYFIRQENAEITEENFHEVVQFGTVRKPYIDSLMRLFNAVYLPRLFRKASWPESIKNEFFSEIYHFMTSLTDTRSKMRGRTVLYVPIESLIIKTEVAVKDKALVQRLESIHRGVLEHIPYR